MLLAWFVPVLPVLRRRFSWLSLGAAGRDRAVVFGLGFLALAVLPFLARQIPTWRIEPEASFVQRSAGNLEPFVWQFDRTSLPEAWVLPDQAALRVPVRRGGTNFRVTVLGRFIRNREADLVLDFSIGGTTLGSMVFSEAGVWRAETGPLWSWPSEAGQRAELMVSTSEPAGTGPPGVTNGLAIDRLELHWSRD
jgi:hypothetical protein